MKLRVKSWWARAHTTFAGTINDLGTVFLGAAAIFLVRAFPSPAPGQPSALFDERMAIACGALLTLGLLLRYAAKTNSD